MSKPVFGFSETYTTVYEPFDDARLFASQVIDFSRLGLDPRHKQQPLDGLHSNNLCPFFTGRVRAPFVRRIISD